MKGVVVKALLMALLLHAGILLFGGLLLHRPPKKSEVREDVDLISETAPDEKKQAEQDTSESDRAEAPIAETQEKMPDLRDLASLESPVAGPALAPMSLGELEAALAPGEAGDGGFGMGAALTSGGRIGASGISGPAQGDLEAIFSANELDQRPRAIYQAPPSYPQELRKRGVQGTVQIVFLVDTDGKVVSPRVERSTNPAFEKPALDSVRQWRFEAGTRNGEKVRFKMRVPISFSAGQAS